jgi:L-2-hydroxyglutarate oxidase LhgO
MPQISAKNNNTKTSQRANCKMKIANCKVQTVCYTNDQHPKIEIPNSNMKFSTDITIIGAGVVGLAIVAQVASHNKTVYVLEKNEKFGLETSSRQSGVIHSGIYYPEGSLKARLCVEGNHLLYELCQKNGIGYKKLGKLIVASSDEEVEQLHELQERGKRNGAKSLKIISKREMKKLEPNVAGVAALLSPWTGIVDSYGLMQYFIARAKENDAQIAYKTKVVGIERAADGYRVTVEENGRKGFSFNTKVLINCAGLYCDKIAAIAGIDIASAGYRLHYCKGEYFSVGGGKSRMVQRLIYPVPEHKVTGVGIHATLDLEGRMRLGPSVEYVDSIDYSVDAGHKEAFYNSAKKMLPFIDYEDLEPEMAGIRPKLQGPGEDIRDFVIRDEADRGLPGFINLIGIESPGLTSSPAIARYVEKIVDSVFM